MACYKEQFYNIHEIYSKSIKNETERRTQEYILHSTVLNQGQTSLPVNVYPLNQHNCPSLEHQFCQYCNTQANTFRLRNCGEKCILQQFISLVFCVFLLLPVSRLFYTHEAYRSQKQTPFVRHQTILVTPVVNNNT